MSFQGSWAADMLGGVFVGCVMPTSSSVVTGHMDGVSVLEGCPH